jgi:pimeloyl-ACP methyl ester carboxylesterase
MATKYMNMAMHSTNVRVFQIRRRVVHAALNTLWKCAPGLSKQIVRQAFLAPSAYRVSAVEEKYLEDSSRFEIPVGDKVIKGWKWGIGPGVLLMHGWHGRGIQFHHFIEPLIQDGHSVITYDSPSHGESEGRTTSYFEMTETIRTLLHSEQGYNIHGVIAHSLGASAVINCMEKEKRGLRAVLIAPTLRLAEMVYGLFDHHGVPKPLYQNLMRELEDQYGYNMKRDNPYNLLEGIDSKILIVHDREDPTVPYVDSQAVSNRLENVSLHTTEGLGHKRILTDESVVDLAVDYLYRISTRRTGDMHD